MVNSHLGRIPRLPSSSQPDGVEPHRSQPRKYALLRTTSSALALNRKLMLQCSRLGANLLLRIIYFGTRIIMTEIRAEDTIDDTIDAKPSTDGEDITHQTVQLSSDQPYSPTSPTRNCAGLSNQSHQPYITDDGYVSDGTMVPLSFGRFATSLPSWQQNRKR